MPVLHLGVIDLPYAYEQEQVSKKGKVLKRKKKVIKSITTGDVAEILENKYHLMELFFETHRDEVAALITDALAHAIESMALGAPTHADPYAAATQQINEAFKHFVLSGEAERIGIPGTPTQAAEKGVSHRKLHPYAKAHGRRVSFYDTGMYVDHFMSWID